MQPASLTQEILSAREYFERSSRVLAEADSTFAPQPGMMTAAQQVAHAAQTIEWFLEGASRPEGFDLDFEKHAADVGRCTSLAQARARLDAAFEQALTYLRAATPESLSQPIPEGPIMGGQPMGSIFGAIIDHTAHHRGALTVYSRLVGKTPLMPYME